MLPAKRCDVAGNFVRRTHVDQCSFEISGVPQDNRGNQQVEPGGAVGLVLEPTVTQLPKLVEKQRAGEGIARLSLVQPGLRRSMSCNQSSMKIERSSRPTSRNASARPFCRG